MKNAATNHHPVPIFVRRCNGCRKFLGFLTKDLVFGEPEEAGEAVTDENQASNTGQATSVSGSGGKGVSIENASISNRDEAFRTLLKVSEFFRRTEPHSPISYNLEQAVKWGRMSLPELLSELIPDERARDEFFKLAGIPEKTDT